MSERAKRKRKAKTVTVDDDDVEMEDADAPVKLKAKAKAKSKAKAKATKRKKGFDDEVEEESTGHKSVAEKPAKRGRVDEEKLSISDIFQKYANSDKLIGPDEMMAFFSDLEIDPVNDIEALVLMMNWKTAQQGFFSREEFINGMNGMGAKDMKTLSQKLRTLTNQMLLDKKQFTSLYQFAFQYCRENPSTRIIDSEIAADMMNVVLKTYFKGSPKANNVSLFVEFIKEQKSSFKTFNLDQWNCVFNFLDTYTITPDGLKEYDVDASWPTIIDSFVEWVQKKDETSSSSSSSSLSTATSS